MGIQLRKWESLIYWNSPATKIKMMQEIEFVKVKWKRLREENNNDVDGERNLVFRGLSHPLEEAQWG